MGTRCEMVTYSLNEAAKAPQPVKVMVISLRQVYFKVIRNLVVSGAINRSSNFTKQIILYGKLSVIKVIYHSPLILYPLVNSNNCEQNNICGSKRRLKWHG